MTAAYYTPLPRPGNPWSQTAKGRAVDLIHPHPAQIDFDDMAGSLARIARYTGHIDAGPYSVAQHCCLMADAALQETGDALTAAYMLLHDGHEYVIGDIATPVAAALAAHAQLSQEPCPYEFRQRFANATAAGLARLKVRLDHAIHIRAGLPPPPPGMVARIKTYDTRMLAMETRQLMAEPILSWGEAIDTAEPIRMLGKIRIWHWRKAKREWLARAHCLLPCFNGSTARRPQASRDERAGPPTPRNP